MSTYVYMYVSSLNLFDGELCPYYGDHSSIICVLIIPAQWTVNTHA